MEWLIKLLFSREEVEERLGDIEQVYSSKKRENPINSRLWYLYQVTRLLIMGINVRIEWLIISSLKNISYALRNIANHKTTSFLNLLGLSTGLLCCMGIFLYIENEMSYDQHHLKSDRIFRVISHIKAMNFNINEPISPAPLKKEILKNIPEVENVTRFRNGPQFQIQYQERQFLETSTAFVDTSFFEIFSIPLVKGTNRLESKNQVMISRNLGKKIFGSINPIGKVVKLDSRDSFVVVGVYEDMPTTSHFRYQLLISFKYHEHKTPPSWSNINYFTYLLLKEGASYKNAIEGFPTILKNNLIPVIEKAMGGVMKKDDSCSISLQPLKEIYLNSDFENAPGDVGDIRYLQIFGITGFLILLIGCINFMNMSTATLELKGKESVIRKILGANRIQIFTQSLTETLVMVVFSLIMAITLLYITLPFLNDLAQKDLTLTKGGFLNFTIFLFLTVSITGIGAGLYPAWKVSTFNPVKVIKGRANSSKGKLRKILVIIQFSTSLLLITSTIIINSQMDYIRNRKLGYDKEQIMIIGNCSLLGNRIKSFTEKLKNDPDVMNVTTTGFIPVAGERNYSLIIPEAHPKVTFQLWEVDNQYNRTFKTKLFLGRDFEENFSSDRRSAIINRKAMEKLGWENPIGKRISRFTSFENQKTLTYTVVGVVEDFHFESLKQKIAPLVMYIGTNIEKISLRVDTDNLQETVEKIEDIWKQFLPDSSLTYSFMDGNFDAQYRDEMRLGKIFGTFALLAIVIGCLGLFGISSFIAQRRTKEIGVRKVLGASVIKIVNLLSKEFVYLVIISNIISIPLSHYAMSRWLANFAYRTEIEPLVFLLAGISALLVALFTVSFHTIKAANSDPVKTLNQE